MSILQYKITNDGKLEIDAGTLNRNGSETFNRDMLYAFCSDFDISISFGNHVPDYIDAESHEVFGGTTYFYKDKKEAFIVLATTNYPKMDGLKERRKPCKIFCVNG